VRGQRRRLRVRPSRHEAAVEESRRDDRRRSHRTRSPTGMSCAAEPRRATGPVPRTRNDTPSLGSKPRGSGPTSASSPPTSTTARPNDSMKPSIARARAGGKSYQVAQDPAFFRSHVVPLGAPPPSPPCSAHWRLLADARRPRRHSESARPCESRIRGIAPQAGRSLCIFARCAYAARSMSDGARCPSRQVPPVLTTCLSCYR